MKVFRLRAYDQVVGYCKMVGRYTFYSKDRLWWRGNEIEHTMKEAECPLRNQYGQHCYVNDIVRCNDNFDMSAKQIIEKDETFFFRDLDTGNTMSIDSEAHHQVKLLFAGLPSREANRSLFNQIS